MSYKGLIQNMKTDSWVCERAQITFQVDSNLCSSCDSLFLRRHQRFEKAFLLAVDVGDKDLFMVSGKSEKKKILLIFNSTSEV